MSSSTDLVMRLSRSCRWYVMAKRCASSRTRCSRYSASDWRGMRIGSALAGDEDLLELLGQRRHRDLVVETEVFEHAHGDAELALAAVDEQQLRRVGELLALLQRPARARRAAP